jgi:hypothetical protein
MAFWNRRENRAGRPVQVYYFDGEKQVGVPRKLYRHLDNEPDHVIEEWVARWSNLNEAKAIRPDLIKAQVPSDWSALIDEFCTFMLKEGRAANTVKDHKRHLLTSLPYFAEVGCERFADFYSYSRRLSPWLTEQGKSARRIWAINQSINLWWEFLDEQKGLVEGKLKLTGGHKTKNSTPLKLILKPEEILGAQCTHPQIRLMMLIGYYFSLRPQETLALTPAHFRAGSPATFLECCKALDSAGLFSKLAVNIERQKVGGKFKAPKKNSVGWVGCFDEAGAREIVSLIKTVKKDELLFPFTTDTYFKLWRKHGLANTVSKDMRRASLYWLGHYSKLPVSALKNHARHQSIETTMLYTRRPEELTDADWQQLDLDA